MKESTRRQLFALMNKAGIKSTEDRQALIYSFSEGMTTSTKELKEHAAIDLIRHLQKQVGQQEQEQQQKQGSERDKADSMRKGIISVWYKIENASTPDERKNAVQKCKAWVEKHFKGELNSFETQKLYQIRDAADKVLKDQAKAIRRRDNENA